jgi:hypothetical protein
VIKQYVLEDARLRPVNHAIETPNAIHERPERSDAMRERDGLASAIIKTLDANSHLADGDVCTLKSLKDALLSVGIDWDKIPPP